MRLLTERGPLEKVTKAIREVCIKLENGYNDVEDNRNISENDQSGMIIYWLKETKGKSG